MATRKRRPPSPARIEYLRYRRAKARARLAKCEVVDFTRADWYAVLKQFNYQCAYCLKPLKRLTKDHVVPLHRGGNHTKSNIVPACKRCNSSKGTKLVEEWFTHSVVPSNVVDKRTSSKVDSARKE